MDIPYGFDCYAFIKDEVKLFDNDAINVKYSSASSRVTNSSRFEGVKTHAATPSGRLDYVMFTRKREDYSKEQVKALTQAGRLKVTETNNQIFCGIKIQIGISVATSFLQTALQYKQPIRGRSELVNGSWTGIVKGLTVNRERPESYDIAFGNFLAYDEEFPYIKFGPFFAIESKLVMLTGGSRATEASAFGTNLDKEVWMTVSLLMFILSVLAAFRVSWQRTKRQAIEEYIKKLIDSPTRRPSELDKIRSRSIDDNKTKRDETSILSLVFDFFFIYITMLLNKPSIEFDDMIWPKPGGHSQKAQLQWRKHRHDRYHIAHHGRESRELSDGSSRRARVPTPEEQIKVIQMKKRKKRHLPTSIRLLSYLWSAACLIMSSIYSGELLAVILVHSDQNIDTVAQLINSKPPIEPVIRQDDFTYNLMLKSLDENLLILHNRTKIIPRTEVYTRRFIEGVSDRKQALLGDDELIETIYDTYHKYYPLYKSKVTYLQYPISIMYRMDLNTTLEKKLRRGMVQIFETGLIQQWYQAQKDTYIQWYDTYEKKDDDKKDEPNIVVADQKYKPLSLRQFESFFRFMTMCLVFGFLVLLGEIMHFRITKQSISQV